MEKIKPEEISAIIARRIKSFKEKLDIAEVGEVVEVGDGIAKIYGLRRAMASEIVEFPHKIFGLILNLEEEIVAAAIFGPTERIKEGDQVRLTGEILRVPTGEALIGRVVNALGEPLDEKGKIQTVKTRPIERIAPGVVKREPVKKPLQTGIKAIDAMIPIGRGQRELIIGDRQTGKTAIALDAIINQKGKDIICIYVAIGQKNSSVASIVKTLQDYGAMDYTIVVSASASEPAPMQYIAPYSACAMGEEFMEAGKDALVIYDDLTKHAAVYRQLSLLLRRPPGREAFPGDIFYTHSRLLERAAKLSQAQGGGSLTAIPIIETQAGDVTTYIPTNVISITDGQIYLESGLFFQGIRPAINVGLSVSRVGGAAQIKAMRQVAGTLRLDLAQFRELEIFAQFGTELDKATVAQLERGRRLVELLKQPRYRPLDIGLQVAVIFAAANGYLDSVAISDIGRFKEELIGYLEKEKKDIVRDIEFQGELTEKIKQSLAKAIEEFKGRFIAS
ncbi:MAG: F0F1 ATP synthase subunit alpha [Candidatus Omnitrophota bacterium]|nr:MAG: F0F1 ATP synthase subunit alpha [Candidatus Omnitrophota bacterium]